MKTLQSISLIILIMAMFTSCKNDETTNAPAAGTGIVSGNVVDAVTNAQVPGVTVTALGVSTTTDTQGKFSLTFTVDSVANVTLLLSKSGYRDTSIVVSVRSGDQLSLQVRLVSTAPAGPGSITGVVKDASSGSPLVGVRIRSRSLVIDPESTLTDATGHYLLSYPVDSTLQQGFAQVNLDIKQAGYRDTSIATIVKFGASTTLPIRLIPLGAAVLTGTVTDVNSGAVVAGVDVSAQGATVPAQSTTTDLLGRYTLAFNINAATIVVAHFSRTGYRDTSTAVELQAGAATLLPMPMRQSAGGGGIAGGSGLAQTIAFVSATPPEVSVYGVGGKETADLAWEVRDSLGLPIDIAHTVALTFSISNGPNGGEYVSPPVLQTNEQGQATTTFNAGTRSGVAQIVATATVGTRTIVSSPVRVVIDGGFPVQDHFTIAPAGYNFAGLDWVNRQLAVMVMAGDKYSNPVAMNTAVYFRSSAGVIQPSVFTDKNGQGSVNLISGNPYPLGAYAAGSDGYNWVVARTIGQGGSTVTDSILVMWSGRASIPAVSPDTFTIADGGSRRFSFTVADELGHALAAGTRITVIAVVPPPPNPNSPVNQVQLGFGVSGVVTLEDVTGSGPDRTDFSFVLSDGTEGNNARTAVVVTISVDGPNGSALRTLTGIAY